MMIHKTPYSKPICEIIELTYGTTVLSASNEGYTVIDTPLFGSSVTDDDTFNHLLGF